MIICKQDIIALGYSRQDADRIVGLARREGAYCGYKTKMGRNISNDVSIMGYFNLVDLIEHQRTKSIKKANTYKATMETLKALCRLHSKLLERKNED
jgi:hypothetical protein